MTEKMKKRLTIAGVSVLGLALAVAIGMQFTKAPSEPDTLPQPEQSTPATPQVQKPELVITPPSDNAENTPAQSLPPQTDLPEQKLQPDAEKPKAPEPPKTPDGTDRAPSDDKNHDFTPESPDAPPAYKPEETEKKPAPPPPPSKPSGGLPGYDNVPNGGANQVTNADDMYENGNKIGDMG